MDLPVLKVGDWNQSEIVYSYTYKSSYVSMYMLIVINYPKEILTLFVSLVLYSQVNIMCLRYH